MNQPDINRICEAVQHQLAVSTAQLPDEYFYSSVVQCVMDAVYSINARYEGVRNVVKRFSTHQNVALKRDGVAFPAPEQQYRVADFVADVNEMGITAYTETVLQNKQRTSPRNGILKGEAVYRFAQILQQHGVQTLQDVARLHTNTAFEQDIKRIPGQKSGTSLVYFFMLAGEEGKIKPDRMVVRFLETALGRAVTLSETQTLLAQTSQQLHDTYPHLTPRLLDYAIWNHTRNRDKTVYSA